MLHDPLKQALLAIGRRLRRQRAADSAWRGWAIAAIPCLLLAVLDNLLAWGTPEVAYAAAPIAVALLFGLGRWMSVIDWAAAARAADAGGGLADRSVTAWEWLERPADPWSILQRRDALQRLEGIDAARVAPWRFAAGAWHGPAMSGVIFLVGLFSFEGAIVEPSPAGHAHTANPVFAAEAERIELEVVEQLERLAEERQSEELERLVQELREKLDALKEPEEDVRQAMLELSSMQEALAASLAAYRAQNVSASLESLGKALQDMEAFRPSAKALQAGRFGDASRALAKLAEEPSVPNASPSDLDRLGEALQEMDRRGDEPLARATEQLQEALKTQSIEALKASANELAELAKQQELRDLIASNLRAGQGALAASKGRMGEAGKCLACGAPLESERHYGLCKACSEKQGQCSNCANGLSPCLGGGCTGAGSMPGGGAGASLARSEALANALTKVMSRNPSLRAGASVHGQSGEATTIESQRQLEKIQGILGAGPSETEKTSSPEGEGRTARSHREVYEQYRKESEAVLDSEAIPLARRAMIRRYFELIRPEGSDGK